MSASDFPDEISTMSDGEEKGSWWGGWMKSAKDKSLSALNMVKRDLAEFSSVMQEDTIKAASKVKEKLSQENANAATEKVKKGVSDLIGGLSKALIIEPDDNYQTAQIIGGEAIVFDRYKARLHALQIDPSTYTTEPAGDAYQDWLSATELDGMKGDISDLLVKNVEVRALYTQLVPYTVPNIDFWRRYYYKQHLLEDEEARRADLMKRADGTNERKDLGWDEDDDDWTEVRAISSGIESCDVKSSSDAVVTEKDEELDEELTTVQPSSSLSNENIADESETAKASTDLIHTKLAADLVEPNETDVATNVEPSSVPDLQNVHQTETSSSNSSEESSVPTSNNNSIDTRAVVTAGDVQSLDSTLSSDPSLGGWSALSEAKIGEDDSANLTSLEKPSGADEVQVMKTPSNESISTKESLDDEWEKDFDVEVTEDDLIAAQKFLKIDATKKSEGANDGPEDWEDW